MVNAMPLGEGGHPGDKGVGLLELRAAGLEIPATVIVNPYDAESAAGSLRGERSIAKVLGQRPDGAVLVRPSLRLARREAAAISGLYPSVQSTVEGLAKTIAELTTQGSPEDDAAEALFIPDAARRKSGLVFLVQPLLAPAWSGVAHVVRQHGDLAVACGIVDGHLSALVEGTVAGWNLELSRFQIESALEVAAVGDEEALGAVLQLPGSPRLLSQLFEGLVRLRAEADDDREVEWAVVDGLLVCLQSQPLATDHSDR